MADADLLPPSVYQGLGWAPGGGMAPPALTGAPDFGGLPPSVVQGMGWAPPPPLPQQDDSGAPAPPPPPPPAPTSLPSMGAPPPAQPPAPTTSATPDYRVPASAFGGGQAPPPAAAPGAPAAGARPAAPQRPQTFDQRMTALDQREADTQAQQQQAIQAGVEAEKQRNALDRAAFEKYDQQAQVNAAARQAENEQWAKIYATNEAKVDADRKQIESWKFNRNAYMDSLGVGDKVSWGIGAVLAGIGNALQGIKTGENPVIQQLQAQIHDANEQQMKERDNLVQKLGMDRQTGLDAQAYHATRQAELDKQDGLALTALSKQLEEAAVKSADPMAQARGMQASAEAKAKADALFQSNIQLRSQHEMQAAQNAIAGGHLRLAQKQFEAEYGPQGFKQQELDIKAADLMRKGKADQAKALHERGVGGLTVDGKPIAEDGSNVLLAPSDKEAEALRKQKAGVDTVNEFVNDMSRQIKEAGGASKWLQSPDFQKMMAKKESLLFALHQAYGVEGFRPGVLEQMEKALGGTDPTSFFRSAEPGLKEARDSLNRTFTAQLRVMDPRFKGEYSPPDTSEPSTPSDTAEDKIYKIVAGSRNEDPGAIYDPKQGRMVPMVAGQYSVDPDAPPTVPPVTAEDRRISADYPRMGPGQKAGLDTIAAMAQSDDPVLRKRALEHLEALAQPGGKANEDGVRGYAQELLNRVVVPPQPTEDVTGATDTALRPYGRTEAPRRPLQVPPALRLR